DGLAADLAADDHHGDGVQVGGGDAGDGIGHAGTAGHQGDADFLGGTGIGVGRMHGCLFVTHENVLEAILLVDCVVDIEHGAAGIAENVFHAFVRERAHDDICAI